MIEQSANSEDSTRSGWQYPPLDAPALSIGPTEIRSARKSACPECGEPVQGQIDSCPACGESLIRPPKPVRCMQCRTVASSELVLCPGCGRELREAPSTIMTLGAPAVLAVLLVALLVTQWEKISPIAWVRSNLTQGVVLVESISASIEPEMVIVMTPIVPDEASNDSALVVAPAESIIVSDTQAVAMAQTTLVTPLPDPSAAAASAESGILAAAGEVSPIGVGGPQNQASSEPSGEQAMAPENAALSVVPEATPVAPAPTLAPTDTPVPTATVEAPTATPEPTATLEPTATPAVAVAAEKNVGLAGTLALTEQGSAPTPTWTTVAGQESERSGADAPPANGAIGGIAQAAALSANQTTLPTPTATATAVTTPLPTPTPTPVVYQVRAGDTLVTIAANYGIEVEALMAANNINEQDVFVLQLGQMLIVPSPAPQPLVTADELAAVRLEAPTLLVPPDAATVGCATGGKLMWQRVQFVKDSDRYVLHLGFVNGQDASGRETITWVLAQSSPVTQTEWELDTALCELAPAEYGQQWRWWVEVVEDVEGSVVRVSPPSELRGFVWQ